MESPKEHTKKSSVLTEATKVDSQEFDKHQALILNESKKRSKSRSVNIELLSLRFEMEDYVLDTDRHSKSVGAFLKDYLKTFSIKQNAFADYIGMKPSNLSKLINDERSINHDLALVLSKIFNTKASLWLDVQDKNKLFELKKKKDLETYALEDLIE